jgi:hypothetical protein
MSTWGNSFGHAWGNSWGLVGAAADNIRIRRHLRRLPGNQDWQSLSLKEIEKQRRIDRKLRLKREGREEQETPQLEEAEEAVETPKSEPRKKSDTSNLLFALRAAHPDDEDVYSRIDTEHKQMLALAFHALKTLQ